MQSIISETNHIWGLSFFSKYSKFILILTMQKKFLKIFFDFEIIAFELVALNTRFYWERILVIGCQYVNKQSQDLKSYYDRIFRADFLSDWSKNLTKILPCRFKQCFGPFNMMTVHNCSDTGRFRHLSNLAFCRL